MNEARRGSLDEWLRDVCMFGMPSVEPSRGDDEAKGYAKGEAVDVGVGGSPFPSVERGR
jgi:hypothetical protein